MKTTRILAAALSFAAVLAGCTREPIIGGIDGTLPGVSEVTVTEAPYDGKSVTLAWDAAQAVAAGAKSFTVELVLTSEDNLEQDKPDNYDSSISGVVPVDPSVKNYSKKIAGQVKGNIYYIRVRANYERSAFSEWEYLMNPKTGDRAKFKLGRGIITEGIEEPYLYKITPTSSGLIVKWDLIPNVIEYEIQYRMAASSEWISKTCDEKTTNFKITNLPSETEYVVRAKSYTAEGESDFSEEQTVKTRQPGSFPTRMSTAAELLAWLEAGIVEVEPSQVFTLEGDIDITGQSFVPMDEPLMGTLDGQGHTITGVSSNLLYQNDGTVKNLTIKGAVKIEGEAPTFGAFVITNNGTITNCTSGIDIEYTTKENCDITIGGFCCENNGTLDHVVNEGSITVNHNGNLDSDYYNRTICIGGIASSSTKDLIECTNKGNVSYVSAAPVLGPAVAGIAGFISGKAVKCTNSGAVSLQIPYSKADAGAGYLPQLEGKTFTQATYYGTPATAGIAAYSFSETPAEPLLDECVNEGDINFTATSIDKYTTTVQRVQAAGIIANPWGLIRNCTNNGALTFAANTTTGSASGGTYLMCCGGIAGGSWFEKSQDVTNYEGCVNNGEIEFVKFDKVGSSNSTCGGIVGWPGAEGSRSNVTKNCTNNGAINFRGTGKARVGGIHGGSGAMNGCINNGEVHCYSGDPASAIGGLAGFSSNGLTIQKCESRGPVISDIAMTSGVSGGVGNLGNSANSGKFTNCVIATKVVNGEADNAHTGMIVGYFNGTSASTPIGASGAVKVSGKIKVGDKTTALTAGNFATYLVGTANASAGNHPVNATFDSTPYVDPEEGSGEPETPALDAPQNVVITILYNSVKISWDEVDGAEWYVVEYKKAGTDEWIAAPRTDKNEYVFENLEHGTSYSFRVRAFTSVGSGYSDVSSGETLPEINLGVPAITAGTPESTSCTISWAAIEGATAYGVEYKEAAAETWSATVTVNATSYEVKGLKPTTTYDVRVKALGEGGNEGEWGTVQFTTDVISYSYPLSISNGSEFADWINSAAAVCVEGNVITLTGDIDLAGKTIDAVAAFAGTLDGNGKTIKNLKADHALFESLSGTVKNLTIDSSCQFTTATTFGVVAKTSAGTISGVTNNAAVNAVVPAAGAAGVAIAAIVGTSTGTVENCTNTGDVTYTCNGIASSPVIAGVAGGQKGGTFTGNKNTGKIKMTHAGSANASVTGLSRKPFVVAGGVAGVIESVTAQGCINEGAVEVGCTDVPKVGARHYVGGVIGTPQNAKIIKCENKGAVKADFTDPTHAAAKQVWVGGVVGGRNGDEKTVDGAYIEDCNNYGTCTLIAENSGVNNYLAGIAGQATVEATGTNYTSAESTLKKIVNCHNYGKLIKDGAGGGRIGGISGGAATIENCGNEGEIVINNISTIGAVGGLVGYPTQTYHPVKGSYNKGNLTATCDVVFAMGGLFGQGGNTNQNYEGCSVDCTISAKSATLVGAILGTAKTLASGKSITMGTAEAPIKVKGTINGTALSADNYTTLLASDGAAVDGVITTAASGTINVANVIFE